MVKYLAVLASLENPILPKVVLLPTRGEHEAMNIIAMIDWHNAQGVIPMICLPKEHQQILISFFKEYRGLKEGRNYQFVEPEQLSAEHFQPTPRWNKPKKALTLAQVVKKHHNS